MSGQLRPLFESSFAALGLVDSGNGVRVRSQARFSRLALPRIGSHAIAMTIQYSPEPVPTEHILNLGNDQTTGPLSLGFQLEFFGARYSWFDISADGFLMFGVESRAFWPGSRPGRRFIPVNPDLNNFLALGWSQGSSSDGVRIAYEVRGSEGRRRLVLSCTGRSACISRVSAVTGQLIIRERTGMIEVHTARYEPGESSIHEHAVRLTTTPVDRHAA